MSRAAPIVIAGGGLSGCLAALALAARRPDIDFLLLEQGEVFGGNHIWSFFDTDVAAQDRWLVDTCSTHHWPDHEIRFPHRQRTIGIGYNSLRSADLDRAVRQRLHPRQYRLGARIVDLKPDGVALEGGEFIEAAPVLDARGPKEMPGLKLGWQKFVGRTYRYGGPHNIARPIIMDATVDQEDGYRFVYSLPFSETELMVEDTYYSNSPNLDVVRLRSGLDRMAEAGPQSPKCTAEETGVLPVLIGGRIESLWHPAEPPIARLGLRGGFFHPTTGYSLPDAVRNAALLVEQLDFSAAATHNLFERRARRLWNERRFFQLLNRMLFNAAPPDQRYRVLEHFYRLPEPTIARFYAARLTFLDKVRILSGRPPVPVGRALAAMKGEAA